MKKVAKTRGITLIALVITIIVLLILAGISIAMLTGDNGILSKSTIAKQMTSEEKVKEKIKLLLAEYQIEKVDNNELTLLGFFESKKEKGEIDDVTDNGDGTIDVKLEEYTVTIDIENESIIGIKKSNNIKISYEIKSFNNNKYQIEIIVTDNEKGIQSVKIAEENTRQYDGQKEIKVDYEIDKDVDYIVTAQNIDGVEETLTINLKTPKTPTIKKGSMHPILTLSGVEIPKIEIEYESNNNCDNYYSLDDGETWIPYTGGIEKSSITTNIIAKSCNKKWPDLCIISDQLTIDKSIGMNAFDNNLETSEVLDTYPKEGKFYVGIDKNVIGKGIYISIANQYYSVNGKGTYINFVDESFQNIQTIKQLSNGGERFVDVGIGIPSNAKYIEIKITESGGPVTVEEIKLSKINNILPNLEVPNEKVNVSVSDFFINGNSGSAWNATDGDEATGWSTNSGNYDPHWYQIEFSEPRAVSAYFLYGAHTQGGAIYKFYIEASNDKNNWVKLEGDTIHSGVNTYDKSQVKRYYIELDNKTPYKYYRIYFPEGGWTYGSSGGVAIYELKLFDDV